QRNPEKPIFSVKRCENSAAYSCIYKPAHFPEKYRSVGPCHGIKITDHQSGNVVFPAYFSHAQQIAVAFLRGGFFRRTGRWRMNCKNSKKSAICIFKFCFYAGNVIGNKKMNI